MMIAFQCYLDQTSPEVPVKTDPARQSFKQWMDSHEEFNQMVEDMETGGMESLVPVEQMSPGDGIALTTEVIDVVNRRFGCDDLIFKERRGSCTVDDTQV
jgi:hypothetical protein